MVKINTLWKVPVLIGNRSLKRLVQIQNAEEAYCVYCVRSWVNTGMLCDSNVFPEFPKTETSCEKELYPHLLDVYPIIL